MAFDLQLWHASDLEGGVDAITSAPNFAAVIDALENQAASQAIASILISSGDNYLPGPFFSAAGDEALRDTLQSFYQDLFGEPGLIDIREGSGRIDISIVLAGQLQPIINDVLDSDDDVLGTADDVNKVILTTHLQQIALEEELASLLSGVDIIIAGGSDTLLADGNDRLRSGDTAARNYPIIATGQDSNPVAIVSTDGQYSYVGRLVITFDDDGVIVPSSIKAAVSGAYATEGNITTPGFRVRSLGITGEDGRISDLIVQDGEIVGDPNREIRLVTLNFLADGGDSYPFDIFGDNRVDGVA